MSPALYQQAILVLYKFNEHNNMNIQASGGGGGGVSQILVKHYKNTNYTT